MSKIERYLLISLIIAILLKVFKMFGSNLIFVGVAILLSTLYMFAGWYYLGIPYKKIKYLVLGLYFSFCYSFMILAITFRIQCWNGALNMLYTSLAFQIVTIFLSYRLNVENNAFNNRKYLLFRGWGLFLLGIIVLVAPFGLGCR